VREKKKKRERERKKEGRECGYSNIIWSEYGRKGRHRK